MRRLNTLTSAAPTPTPVFFRRSTHFLGFSRSKIAKTLPGRDATSVLCPFSFQPCVGAYVGRAHTYAHFGAVACMRSRSPSATSYLSVCRGGGSQLRFFFYSVKRHVTFSTRWHHHPQRPHQFAYFSDARCIFYGFPGQKSIKHWPDVTQRSFCVRFCSNLAWGPTSAMHTPS